MKHLEKLARKHLGEILVDEGLISKSQLVDAEREKRRSGDPLGSILVEANNISDWDLAKTMATQYQLPFVELGTVGISPEIENLFLVEEQKKRRFIPIDRIGNVLTLAVADMPDMEFLRAVQERTGFIPFLFVALLSEIQKHFDDNSDVAAPAAPAPEPVAPAGPVETVLDEATIQQAGDWEEGLSVFDEPEEAPDEIQAEDVGEEWKNIFDSGNDSVLKEIDQE